MENPSYAACWPTHAIDPISLHLSAQADGIQFYELGPGGI